MGGVVDPTVWPCIMVRMAVHLILCRVHEPDTGRQHEQQLQVHGVQLLATAAVIRMHHAGDDWQGERDGYEVGEEALDPARVHRSQAILPSGGPSTKEGGEGGYGGASVELRRRSGVSPSHKVLETAWSAGDVHGGVWYDLLDSTRNLC